MSEHEDSDNLGVAVIVGSYATPLAVLLVVLGVVLSSPASPVKEICVSLLVFGIVFNLWAVSWLKRLNAAPLWFLRLRVVLNFGMNAVQVYLLGPYFEPIWLLLALQAMAVAIYDSRAKTMTAAVAAAIVLLAVHATRGLNGPADWGVPAAHSVYIALSSLMANALAGEARRRIAGSAQEN